MIRVRLASLGAPTIMSESIDDRKTPPAEEFEKLEFLPERPAPQPDPDEEPTGEIIFLPEGEPSPEPPLDFAPEPPPVQLPTQSLDVPDLAMSDLDLDADTPFELFGTSLFLDPQPEPDDPDDDLIF